MQHETYVTYEQAVKLHKLGFDRRCAQYYTNDYVNDDPEDVTREVILRLDYPYNHNKVVGRWTAPRLDQAQAWLRETKHIYVYPEINCLKKWLVKAVDMERNEDLIWDGTMFDVYEAALSAGITATLKLLEDHK